MENKTPIYTQLATLLKEKITNGDYQVGEALPSERKLAEAYGINRLTVRAALKNLQQEGIIVTLQGKGNFVSSTKIRKSFSNFNGFASMLKEKGVISQSKVIMAKKIYSNYQISKIFGVDKGTPFYRLVRLRLGNGQPLRIEDVHIPYNLIPNVEAIDFSKASLYNTLEQHGIHLDHANQLLTTYNITDEPAILLEMQEGDPIYWIEYQTFDTHNRLVEYTISFINPKKSLMYCNLK